MAFLNGRAAPVSALRLVVAARKWVFPTALAFVGLIGTLALAQKSGEYEVKAAFLYKFANFVEWPQDAAGPICIGVLGDDPFGPVLDEVVKGRSVNGRPFQVRRLKPGYARPDCQIVFVSAAEKPRIRTVLEHLEGPVLTIGDTPGFCEAGGIINFDVVEGRVRLQINPEASEKARLRLSSKLLSLAAIVHRQGQ